MYTLELAEFFQQPIHLVRIRESFAHLQHTVGHTRIAEQRGMGQHYDRRRCIDIGEIAFQPCQLYVFDVSIVGIDSCIDNVVQHDEMELSEVERIIVGSDHPAVGFHGQSIPKFGGTHTADVVVVVAHNVPDRNRTGNGPHLFQIFGQREIVIIPACIGRHVS